MKVVNNIHVICKGAFLSLAFHMFVLGFVVITGFNTSLPTITGVFVISAAVSSFYVGSISDRYAEINGIIVSLLVSLIAIGALYLFIPTDLKANIVIVASYVSIGFLFSLLSRLTNKKLRTETKGSAPKSVKEKKVKIKPSNEKLLNQKTPNSPLKHSAKKKVDSYSKATSTASNSPTTAFKSNTSEKGVEKLSEQESIRQGLLKEIEREKAQRKSKN